MTALRSITSNPWIKTDLIAKILAAVILIMCAMFSFQGCKSLQKGEITPPPPVATPAHAPSPAPEARPSASVDQIIAIASGSKCASYSWKDRGRAPMAYVRGMSLVFARSVCNLKRPDVEIVAQAKTGNDRTDALSWYDSNFKALGMTNDVASVDTLRHAYALLIGLGMRESSGKHCCGRDMSPGANFSSADTAEAGLFQASWGARDASAELPKMFERYKADRSRCLLDTFAVEVKCFSSDAKSWGSGDGAEWQSLTKSCPAFAAEYAAVLLRTTGGTRGEFGPLRTKAAEVRSECDAMLREVQAVAESSPEICAVL